MTDAPLTTTEFEAALRAKGAFYHIHHPYHVAMYEGRASRVQLQRTPGAPLEARFLDFLYQPIRDATGRNHRSALWDQVSNANHLHLVVRRLLRGIQATQQKDVGSFFRGVARGQPVFLAYVLMLQLRDGNQAMTQWSLQAIATDHGRERLAYDACSACHRYSPLPKCGMGRSRRAAS